MSTETATKASSAFSPVAFPERSFRRWLRRRQESGGDRLDEVWEGVYVVSPIADIEHQSIGRLLANAIESALDDSRAQIFNGTNVSDRDDWTTNYRIPDVAVFLAGSPAQNRRTFWLGGPDFAAEILSRGDRARKKFDFYAKVGVRSLLLVGRRPWKLELFRREGSEWSLFGASSLAQPTALHCPTLGLNLRLVPGEDRPRIEVCRGDDGPVWFA